MTSALAGYLPTIEPRPLPRAIPRPSYDDDEPLVQTPWRLPRHERPTGQRLIQRLLTITAAEHGVSVAEMLGTNRAPHVVRARDHVAALLRWSTSLSLPTLGSILNRDHTSVMCAIRRHERAINGEKPEGK